MCQLALAAVDMNLESELMNDPRLEAIMYLETKRHGLAFAISYLHWEPTSFTSNEALLLQQRKASGEEHASQSNPAQPLQGHLPITPGQAPMASSDPSTNLEVAYIADAAVCEVLENLEWTTVLTMSQMECGSYMEALANLTAAILGLGQLLRTRLEAYAHSRAHVILCDMLILQVGCCSSGMRPEELLTWVPTSCTSLAGLLLTSFGTCMPMQCKQSMLIMTTGPSIPANSEWWRSDQ